MKLAIFLVLSWFIASNCTATTIETLKKISKGEYGRTLLDTIELELHSSTKDDPRPRILHLLQDIKDEALEALDALNQRHTAQQDQCKSEQEALQSAIDGLNTQINSDRQESSAKSSELDAVTQARDAKQAVVDTLQPYLDQLTATRQQEQADFETEDNRRAQIVAVLEKTRQFITDRLEARQGEVSSFLEKENVLIQVKETVLGADFQKVSPGWGQLIAFLATKALNKMKQDADAQAVAGLQSIVDLINQIIADTNVFRTNAQAANNAEQAAYDEESASLNNQLTLARADIAADDANIGVLNDRISELKAAVASNGGLVSDKQNELVDSQTRCKQEDDEYSTTFSARNDELNLIDQVIAIVNNDLYGLRQYTENTIANADIEVSESSDS